MKYKFNPFERAVGLFLLFSLAGSLLTGLGIAIKKYWFEEKVYFYSFVESASNIRVGGAVQLAGLKIGSIEDIEIDEENRLKVKYSVLSRYSHSVTEGTKAQFVRPFIIGDKTLNLLRGPADVSAIPSGSLIPTASAFDVMDILSGPKISSILEKADAIFTNLDQLVLISKNLALQVSEKDKVKKILENITLASQQLKQTPQMAKDASAVLNNLQQITGHLNELKPVISSAAARLPEGSAKTLELLNETVTVIKAMQKNYFLRDHVDAVRKQEQTRLPASE